MASLAAALVITAAVAAALLGGVYFAFSAFAMRALGTLDPAAGIAAMRAINRVIVRSPFMPLFFCGPAVAIVAAAVAPFAWPAPAAAAVAVGALVLCASSGAVTVVRNVPLNRAFERAAEPDWHDYAEPWTRWNHVRTGGCTIAAALFCTALALA